ncbi:hypothetical protein BR93DRAFT_933097 [Coniochaeta sp. PMI_546]|nr:hypothetical protein BR93DRAFT_933097 [Coniochaeta sp. PMI_546]
MDGQNFTFAGFPYPQSAMEDPVFQPHNFDGHFNPVIGSYLDPNLQPPPSDPYLSQWEREPPQVKRWISDDQRTAYFNADPYSIAMLTCAQASVGTRPVPPPFLARFASPVTSSDHGLTAPSPLAETESFYDHNLPSTPSDAVGLSPSYHPVHFEYYNSQEEAIQFNNMGPAASPAYVKPGDVDPSQDLGYCDGETSQPDFSLEDMNYSFGSGTSHYDVDPAPQNQITVAFTNKRVSSPEEMRPIKVEREASGYYPPPSQRDDDDEDDASEAPAQRPFSKRKKDDQDHDYTPGKKMKPSGSASPRRTRPKAAPPKASPPKRNTASTSGSTSQNPPAKPPPTTSSSATKGKAFSCRHCKHTTFKDQTSLDSHVKKQHTRPFKCVFHFGGCTSTFASKNEWKRHNSTQHLVLHYWLCTEGQCGKTVNGSSSGSGSSSSRPSQHRAQAGSSAHYSNTFAPPTTSSTPPTSSPPVGVRFNRKDLYTQHVRRMHMPPDIKKALKALEQQKAQQQQARGGATKGAQRKAAPQTQEERTKQEWEERLKRRQEAAVRDRIALPTHMRCPAAGCGAEFNGADAWDLRMEHVAKHLESGDRGEVNFGGGEDGTLVEWAASPAVGVIVPVQGGWRLVDVPKSGSVKKDKRGEEEEEVVVVGEIVVDDGERDAEGEEDDEV